MLPEAHQAVDMFCRILVAVDQDVVSLDIPRSSSLLKTQNTKS